jgi:hypothetical protein
MVKQSLTRNLFLSWSAHVAHVKMQSSSGPSARTVRNAVLLAALLTVLLTAGRTLVQWPMLSMLGLPDNDDMMRLAEVRDWIAGQDFSDLTQHRLGPPGGASMHWSRIADLGPAIFMKMFTPIFGGWGGTLAMLVFYQAVLLFTYLLLAARNARLLIGTPAMPIAVIFAALAFPTVSLFVPGRIDHHALQIVLTMVVVGMLIGPPTFNSGIVGGIAAALSLAVGLEVAPELVVAMAVMGIQWLIGDARDDRRAGGFAVAVGGVTLALLVLARPQIWPTEWCDGFTPASTRATLAVAAAWGMLALAGRYWQKPMARLVVAAIVAGVATVLVLKTASVCFAGPYGALDPYLQRAWMSNVAEARGMFYGPAWYVTALPYGGLCIAGAVAAILILRDPAERQRWWPVALFVTLCAIGAILQIRISYVLAGIATLPFAALMVAAQRKPALAPRLVLWLAGSGIVWALVGTFVAPSPQARGIPVMANGQPAPNCIAGRELLKLARMPQGLVMAPLDSSAYVIGMTPHRSVAAPYHRNNIGNLAMYRFFMAPPERAHEIARAWSVNYVVTCPSSLDQAEVQAERIGSLIEALQAGRTPAWLTPVAGGNDSIGGMTVYRVTNPH